jgi:hypothetical protein
VDGTKEIRRIRTSDFWIREARKHADPDPDPQHWFQWWDLPLLLQSALDDQHTVFDWRVRLSALIWRPTYKKCQRIMFNKFFWLSLTADDAVTADVRRLVPHNVDF